MLTSDNLSPTDLDHDAGKRKNVCFLAVCARSVKDLRCSPQYTVFIVCRDIVHRSHVLRACGKTNVCDLHKACGVYKDVLLCGCQYSGGTGSRTMAYPLEISMDHITGVEVIETFSDIR